jgi:hypothetical protein
MMWVPSPIDSARSLVEAAPDPGLALSALMCVAASVIHRMEKCDECTDPDMVLKSAFRILAQQLEGQRRAEGHRH